MITSFHHIAYIIELWIKAKLHTWHIDYVAKAYPSASEFIK